MGALALLIRLQGHRLLAVVGQLPRRADVPGDVPRRRRRDHGLAPARLSDQAGVAVGIAAGVAAVLRLPLSAVVIATVLTAKSGDGVEPLVIVGSVVALVVTLLL